MRTVVRKRQDFKFAKLCSTTARSRLSRRFASFSASVARGLAAGDNHRVVGVVVQADEAEVGQGWEMAGRTCREVQRIPTAVKAASTAVTLKVSWFAGSARNRVRALATTARRLSVNCEVRDSRCVRAR